MPPKVLLAQTSAADRAETELALNALGWEVCATTSAKEACELAKTQEFEFVLLDLVLEDGDGYVVARTLREAEGGTNKTCIVAMGTLGPDEDQACLNAGMDGVINSTCNQEELKQQLQKWIAKLAFRMWKTEGMPRLTLDRIWTSGSQPP
jgi:CheY-like chemotaxis protein